MLVELAHGSLISSEPDPNLSKEIYDTVPSMDSIDIQLGDFDPLWRYLADLKLADAVQVERPEDDHSDLRRARKREARKARRRVKHESDEQVAVSIPDLVDCSSASDTDGIATSEDDSANEDKYLKLRDELDSHNKLYQTTARARHSPLQLNVRIESLHKKLKMRSASSTASHIFVDSSNIYLGFQRLLQDTYPETYPAYSHRKPFMDLAVLSTILQREGPAPVKVLVGSSPVLQSWAPAKSLGYEVSILERVTKQRVHLHGGGPVQHRKAEQGVDELIHMKMLESILDAPPSHMVLASGDANVAEYSNGFYNVITKALARGWTVDVVAFCQGLNKLWENDAFRRQWGPSYNILYLDDYIDELEA